jgi:predicted metal-dependent hydrolase
VAQLKLSKLALASPDEEGYVLEQGIIHLRGRIWIGSNSALQTKLINTFHSTAVGGHSGIQATYQRIKNMFVWPGLKYQVDSFVRQCAVCQHAKHTNKTSMPSPTTAYSKRCMAGP